MEKSVCRIYGSKTTITGFLCLIPFKNYLLKVIITGDYDFEREFKIKILFGDNKEKIIKIDKFTRRMYKRDFVSIMELKENEFDSEDYLLVDKDIWEEKDLEKTYLEKEIYIILYPEGHGVKFSASIIKHLYDYGKTLLYDCQTNYGSCGAPILNSNTLKVIGIHLGRFGGSKTKLGHSIKYHINNFIEEAKFK